MMAGLPILAVQGVTKRFGATVALHDVSMEVPQGGCHAVIGENGAGKSTLMRIIAGLTAPDSGEVRLAGVPLKPGVRGARRAGVALVHQELSLVPSLSAAENITLGSQPSRFGLVATGERRAIARRLFDELDVQVDPEIAVERLSLAERQLVEIAKALRFAPKLLILDEPTSSLTPRETADLLALLRRLAVDSVTILYISHRLPEITTFCDSATVLRDGHKVADVALADTSVNQLVRLMVGRELMQVDAEHVTRSIGEPLLVVDEVTAGRVGPVSLEVRAGEILGLGGLVGAGRTEIVRAIVGLQRRDRGTVRVHGREGDRAVRTLGEAMRAEVGYVPEDRRREGVAVTLSVADNAGLPSVRELSPAGLLRRSGIARLARKLVERLDVRPPSIDQLTARLSGGNQQKVAIGKWLVRAPRLLVLDEPTRGVDVGSKADIHRQIRDVASSGAAVLLVSSDLPELLSLSDRIAVMRDGRIVGEISASDANEERVMAMAAGLGVEAGGIHDVYD